MKHSQDSKKAPILVTGGAGFIGANFILNWIDTEKQPVVNLDKLTYAGNLNNLASLELHPLHTFVQGDMGQRSLVRDLFQKHRPRAVVHFAAETHVDRSIHRPEQFVSTNIVAGFALLEEALAYWKQLDPDAQQSFRFLNISTDEVYGSLGPQDAPSTEESRFAPNSPYAASKASFDHLVRAFHHTYGLPVLTTYCTNNFGPFQFPEKLLPLMIVNALQGKPLPIYGDGLQKRNWIYVVDHCEAVRKVLAGGVPGSCYNIGDMSEMTNLAFVHQLCVILDELKPDSPYRPHVNLIKHVKDRPGHDQRYALDSSKMRKELGWQPKESFDVNLRKTVAWYLHNLAWLENVISGDYRAWITTHYG